MKKSLLFQIICTITLSFLGTGTSSASFSDVSVNHSNSDAIEYVKTNGIVSGYPDGAYKPDKTINRAEFTKIIVGAKYDSYVIDNCISDNIDSNKTYVHFPDVTKDAWYAKYICVAKTHNIVQGYSNGFFEPSSRINFAEAAKIIVNTFGYSVSSNAIWYKPFVEKLSEKKTIPTTISDFNQRITRGEMAEMIYRLKANISSKPSVTYNSIAGISETQYAESLEDNGATNHEENIVCSSGNSSGGDGNYNVCIGNTITHQPSGLTAMLLTADDTKIELSVSGMPGGGTTAFAVYKNGNSYTGGNNYEVIYKYNETSISNGANITISSNPLAIPEPAPTPTPTVNTSTDTSAVIKSNMPKKFLTLIVVNSASQNYEDRDAVTTVKFKGNDDIQVFDITIWGQFPTLNPDHPKKISLYNFDNIFEPYNTEFDNNPTAWINYRESFNVLNIDIAEPSSLAYLEGFKKVFKKIVEIQPAEHYGIKYLGHGAGGGDAPIFGYAMLENDGESLFSYFNTIIGKKIDFLDWNTQCGYGTYNVVRSQYPYANYILGSDLIRGGYTLGQDGTIEDHQLEHIKSFETFFSPEKTIRQSLIDMVNSEKLFWTKVVKNDMTTNKIKQSISIFDTSKFQGLMTSANLENELDSGDVLDYVRENYPQFEQKFYDFRFHYISNKDFFPWGVDTNGFSKIWE